MKYFCAYYFIFNIKKALFLGVLSLISMHIQAQGFWQISELSNMPEPVSNNAVTTDGSYVYSFMGIDSTKLYSGIHLKGFRYDITNDSWDTLPSVPDNQTRIAGSASWVNGKIYIIGGYHVYSNGGEVSSKNVFIYDPNSNSYTNGADLPVATDDHIQCIWQDSLIYLISGWSDTANIRHVQIYNPELDTWSVGSLLPGGSDYKAFGAAGVIVNNTIYYAGGVDDTWVFSILPKMRIGIINPNDPTNITWSTADDTLAALYRSGAAILNGHPIWFGGADKAYNYNGIEYGTGAGVEPLNSITNYNPLTSSFTVESGNVAAIMDLRGVAQIDSNKYIIAGGMGPGQVVSDKTFLLEYVISPGIAELRIDAKRLSTYPNPASSTIRINWRENISIENWLITDARGKLVNQGLIFPRSGIEVSRFQNGLYILHITTRELVSTAMFIIMK